RKARRKAARDARAKKGISEKNRRYHRHADPFILVMIPKVNQITQPSIKIDGSATVAVRETGI
ncbi:MAG: hypothetical protein MUF26_02985, partial [Syntrophales bacterium]|nr:hypothetical protein [Syntrophales bacterium]